MFDIKTTGRPNIIILGIWRSGKYVETSAPNHIVQRNMLTYMITCYDLIMTKRNGFAEHRLADISSLRGISNIGFCSLIGV